MCSGKNGGWGIGDSARQGSLGVIVQAAASAATLLVTAAVPRELRIDPCKKKSRRGELGRVEQRSVDGRSRGSRCHNRSTFYSENAAAEFAKICVFR